MEVELRSADRADARFVWEVNNDPSVRAQSISTDPIPWEGHLSWYEKKLADPRVRFFIALAQSVPAAIVRFDVDDASHEATVSVAVHPSFRGKGLGALVIDKATTDVERASPGVRVVAWVRPTNEPSLRAFARAGFVHVGRDVRDGVTLERFVRRRC